jgi:hypothetical protein
LDLRTTPFVGYAIAAPAAVPQLNAKDKTTVVAATDFETDEGKCVRCEESPSCAGYRPGRMEDADVNRPRHADWPDIEIGGRGWDRSRSTVLLERDTSLREAPPRGGRA